MSDSMFNGAEIAIVGMAGRFPGARSIDAFWDNLRGGVESVSHFEEDEVRASGVPLELIRHPDYVRAAAVLEGVEEFDALAFGYSPREAERMDPQHRMFLECAVEALEDAGYGVSDRDARVGVYAGCSMNAYFSWLIEQPKFNEARDLFPSVLGNDKDFLATRVAYKLNLEGPAVTIQTACSTSLVAVHMACQALLAGDCDLALAGGVTVKLPQRAGYLYVPEGILSPDGCCRPFSARAQGTVEGSGVGLVVLKRLADAMADRDDIRVVVLGTAINNDGARKVGYTAPRIEGQARVIRMAQATAGVHPDTLSYIEAHGTATSLGDPIEMEALTNAFRRETHRTHFCAIGSVKSNIGHLNSAAGIAGLIKTVCALEHGEIPPSLHFDAPNPKIDFERSPFFVADRLLPWSTNGQPRRAGVSSFGVGGTNAHVLVQEAPSRTPPVIRQDRQLVLFSASSDIGLEATGERLTNAMADLDEPSFAQAAFTLQVGRRARGARWATLCADGSALRAAWRGCAGIQTTPNRAPATAAKTVFLFPGQGAQYIGMARETYRHESVFRTALDKAFDVLEPLLNRDPRTLVFSEGSDSEAASQILTQTVFAQPILLAVELALARLWFSWGVQPVALLGHSVGEYAAACLAGVLEMEDVLRLIVRRSQLIQALPAGAMSAIPLAVEELRPFLGETLDVAAVNAPAMSVVAGTAEALNRLEAELAARGVQAHRLHTSHAFHSRAMEPIIDAFREELARVRWGEPKIPLMSCLTGTWAQPGEMVNAEYWIRHLRAPVQFAAGFRALVSSSLATMLEVGPGRTLCTLGCRNLNKEDNPVTLVSSLPHLGETLSDHEFLLTALAKMWMSGVDVDWQTFHEGEQLGRIRLPPSPFQRQKYWINRPQRAQDENASTPLCRNTLEPGAITPPVSPKSVEGDARPSLLTTYQAPQNDLETMLVRIWEELLGVRPIGVQDNFFELGGDSLLATQIISRLREAVGADISLQRFLEARTVKDLAAAVIEIMILAEVACPAGEKNSATTPVAER